MKNNKDVMRDDEESKMSADKSQAARDFEIVSNEAPRGSSEHQLYTGRSRTPTLQGIEYRIDFLKNKAPHLSFKYKEAAIAYLQEELERRRQGK